MKIVKLTHKKANLTLWISVEEICYMSREGITKPSSIIMVNEKEEFTIVALKSGRNIMVDQTPEEIMEALK